MLVREKSDKRVDAALTIVLAAATALAFLPLLQNQFVNWDDPYALTGNAELLKPGVSAWAFTTTLMGHYQPLSWLVWSAVARFFGLNPLAFHALSLIGHLANTVLVYVLGLRLTGAAGMARERGRVVAAIATTAFAIHPMRVEPVAWASAFPYVLSLFWLLLATLAYIRHSDKETTSSFLLALACYTASLLSRATAITFPIVLLVLDAYPLRRTERGLWRALIEKIPFAAIALALAIVESRSRELTSLEDIGPGVRLVMAATAPLEYLGRALRLVDRSPVNPLPLAPRMELVPLMLALASLSAITLVVWRLRRSWPALVAGWTAYLVLLAPVMGLTPSGQTATADRYMYVPGVVLSLVAGLLIVHVISHVTARLLFIAAAATLALMMGLQTWQQTQWWHDSVALWTRALAFDARNDIAAFNLAVAFDNDGRKDEAIARYEETLALIPDHEPARRALVNLRADRGLSLVKERRFAAAAADLRFALDTKRDDVVLASALAFSLAQIDRSSEAVVVLKDALARHPDNDELAHNLARLLATSPDPGVRDGTLALRLALAVRERTGGRDPRVLDTLAAAYAAAGQPDNARAVRSEAVTLARQLGNSALADEIASHEQSARQ